MFNTKFFIVCILSGMHSSKPARPIGRFFISLSVLTIAVRLPLIFIVRVMFRTMFRFIRNLMNRKFFARFFFSLQMLKRKFLNLLHMATIKLRYFKPEEFEKATPACSIEQMDDAFLQKLDEARSICVVPFVLNSCFRSREYEISKGRSGSSSHTKGLAVDIRCVSDGKRLRMLLALLAVGFRRIGIYPTFIHVDMDTSKSPCIWLGRSE